MSSYQSSSAGSVLIMWLMSISRDEEVVFFLQIKARYEKSDSATSTRLALFAEISVFHISISLIVKQRRAPLKDGITESIHRADHQLQSRATSQC